MLQRPSGIGFADAPSPERRGKGSMLSEEITSRITIVGNSAYYSELARNSDADLSLPTPVVAPIAPPVYEQPAMADFLATQVEPPVYEEPAAPTFENVDDSRLAAAQQSVDAIFDELSYSVDDSNEFQL